MQLRAAYHLYQYGNTPVSVSVSISHPYYTTAYNYSSYHHYHDHFSDSTHHHNQTNCVDTALYSCATTVHGRHHDPGRSNHVLC